METKLSYPAATIDDLLGAIYDLVSENPVETINTLLAAINALAHGNNIKQPIVAHGTISSGTENFSVTDGGYHTVTAAADFTVSFSDWPDGKVSSIVMECTNFGAGYVSFPLDVDWGGEEPAWKESGSDLVKFTNIGGVIYGEILQGLEFISGFVPTIYVPGSGDLLASDLANTNISNWGQTSDNTQGLCDCGPGMAASFKIVMPDAGDFYLQPKEYDRIYLDNIPLEVGNKVKIESPSSGNIHTFVIESFLDSSWYFSWAITSGPNTTITDGGGGAV